MSQNLQKYTITSGPQFGGSSYAQDKENATIMQKLQIERRLRYAEYQQKVNGEFCDTGMSWTYPRLQFDGLVVSGSNRPTHDQTIKLP